MSKFVKTAIAAAMVMGVFTSTATIAAGNNGTARFYGTIEDSVLMNPLMILVKIIKLRWIHILSYDQMVSRKINNQTTRCANSIF
ncbi:hypothetical protein RSW05_22740, partial [Escherichia coli]